MGRRGDGIYKRGRAWWVEFRHKGRRYQFSLGRNISRSVAAEIAIAKRSAVLKGEVGIGRKRRDIAFEEAKRIYLEWVKANKRAKTYRSYSQCLGQLEKSFKGKTLGQIHPFLVEKHKQRRVAENARVAANRLNRSELPLKPRAEMLNYPTSLRMPYGILLRAGWECRGQGIGHFRR